VLRRGLIACVLVSVTGCLDPRVFPCADNGQCVLDGQRGECVPPGHCAYEDQSCTSSGLRFGPSADQFSGDCVPPGGVSGSASEAGPDTGDMTASSVSDTTDPMSCDTGCMVPPGPCFESPGTCNTETELCEYAPKALGAACEPDDPCELPGTCNGAGECDGGPVDCTDPGPCEASPGTCNPETGACEYEGLSAGSPCEDGDDCTLDDTCDAGGNCVPGPECVSDNPCETGVCQAGSCVFTPVADGMSCGMVSADRCCGGTCVDISSDASNCGGCGLECDPSQSCEAISVTNTCDPSPADTSGRCTCAGLNAQCPPTQVCRTVTPFDNRCAPDDASDCPGTFVDVASCPNFCRYD
jgi:hypothetical protein